MPEGSEMMLEYVVQILREAGQYVAQAMPLDVMSSGQTPQAAREALAEAVRVFVATAKEMGTFEDILEECGYRQEGGRWNCPEWVATERQALAI
jgi:predicted RNase H-like HicB family nuclease